MTKKKLPKKPPQRAAPAPVSLSGMYTLLLTEGELEFVKRTAQMYHDRTETPFVLKGLLRTIVEKCERLKP